MSIRRFRQVVRETGLGSNDVKWLPIWLSKYAQFHSTPETEKLAVDRERAIAFLCSLKDRGQRAWQRLQAVRALQYYEHHVLGRTDSELRDVRIALADLAAREKRDAPAGEPEEVQARRIDPNERRCCSRRGGVCGRSITRGGQRRLRGVDQPVSGAVRGVNGKRCGSAGRGRHPRIHQRSGG